MPLRRIARLAREWRVGWWTIIVLVLAIAAAPAAYRLVVGGDDASAGTLGVARAVEVLGACLVAAIIAWRASHAEAARSLVVFLAVVTLAWSRVWFDIRIFGFGAGGDSSPARPLGEANALLMMITALAASAAFAHFTSRFPRRLTDADIMRGVSPSGLRLRLAGAWDTVARLVPLRPRRPVTVRRARPAIRVRDTLILGAAVTSPLLMLLAGQATLTGKPVRVASTLFLGADVFAYGSLLALLATALGPPIRRSIRDGFESGRLAERFGLLGVVTVLCALALAIGDASRADALGIVTMTALLVGAWDEERVPWGRQLDWWLAVLIVMFATAIRNGGQTALGSGILMSSMLAAAIVAPVRAGQHLVRHVTALLVRRPAEAAGSMSTEAAPEAAGDSRGLRRLLIRPRALWSVVLLVALPALAAMAVFAAMRSPLPASTPDKYVMLSNLASLALLMVAVGVPALAMVVFMVGGALQLRLGYALSAAVERRRAIWIVAGLIASVALLILGVPGLALVLDPARPLGKLSRDVLIHSVLPLTTLSVAVAVFHHGAVDPKIVLRKASLYSFLGIVGIVLYATLENLLEAGLATYFGLPTTAGPWVACGIVALTLGPQRDRIAAFLDDVITRMFPDVALGVETEDTVAVIAMDIADDFASSSAMIRDGMRRMTHLHRAARGGAHRHGGRMVEAGRDVVLMEYPDAGAALAALSAIEADYERRCVKTRVPVAPIRAGMHLGPVLRHWRGGLFGPVVDFAEELRRQAPAGTALVTDAIVKAVRPDLSVEARGVVVPPGGAGNPISTFELARSPR